MYRIILYTVYLSHFLHLSAIFVTIEHVTNSISQQKKKRTILSVKYLNSQLKSKNEYLSAFNGIWKVIFIFKITFPDILSRENLCEMVVKTTTIFPQYQLKGGKSPKLCKSLLNSSIRHKIIDEPNELRIFCWVNFAPAGHFHHRFWSIEKKLLLKKKGLKPL